MNRGHFGVPFQLLAMNVLEILFAMISSVILLFIIRACVLYPDMLVDFIIVMLVLYLAYSLIDELLDM